MKHLIIISLLLISINGFSQAFSQYNFGNFGGSLNFNLETTGEDIDGSPYVNDSWEAATIYYANDSQIELPETKFNTQSGDIIFNYENKAYRVPDKKTITNFLIGDRQFIGAFDDKNKYEFYELMQNGTRIALLKKYRCTILKGNPSKGYIEGTNSKYLLKEEFYVKGPNQNVVEIRPNKGIYILDHIQSHQGEVKFYIKENKLKMKTVEDLLQVIDYYNSI